MQANTGRMIVIPSFGQTADPAPAVAVQDQSQDISALALGSSDGPTAITVSDPGASASVQIVPLQTSAPVFIAPEALTASAPDALPVALAGQDCSVAMTADPMPSATVALSLNAPCNGGEAVTFYHEGLEFTQTLDANGTATVQTPALVENSVFIATFADGSGAVADAQVPDATNLTRVVLQWDGAAAFELHARENGAAYGAPGHVWSGAPTGAGQFLALGDGALQAEVYTLPAGLTQIELTVEAQVSATNCGRPVAAETLQTGPDGEIVAQSVEMIMPGCDATGDYLVLHNMLEHLTLASR